MRQRASSDVLQRHSSAAADRVAGCAHRVVEAHEEGLQLAWMAQTGVKEELVKQFRRSKQCCAVQAVADALAAPCTHTIHPQPHNCPAVQPVVG